MADATPTARDRYVDFLRALAILAVVCGHWLIATIQRSPHGIEVGNVLSHQAGLRPVTWVFQVMGVFFVVGGFSTRRTIEAKASFDAGGFFATRVERLLRPTLVFVVAWLAAAVLLQAAGVDAGLTHVRVLRESTLLHRAVPGAEEEELRVGELAHRNHRLDLCLR